MIDPKQLFSDDDAVSPVVGAILMIAITVILAAVIASFVLGLGAETGPAAPQATWDFNWDSGASEVTITHTGGDTVDASAITINSPGTVTSPFPTEISSGNTAAVDASSGDKITITWTNPEGDQTQLLAEYTVP